jgi:hypothetical protein
MLRLAMNRPRHNSVRNWGVELAAIVGFNVCLATVATVQNKRELARYESVHVCEPVNHYRASQASSPQAKQLSHAKKKQLTLNKMNAASCERLCSSRVVAGLQHAMDVRHCRMEA